MKRLIAAVVGGIIVFYLLFVNYTEPIEAGIAWNRLYGTLTLQDNGWHISAPWVSVSVIDTTPQRVCVPTSGRDVGCKLVEFKREAYKEFVATQGFRYWWWSNRISFNFGYDDEYRGMKDIIRGYAFSGKHYPFIEVLKTYGDNP